MPLELGARIAFLTDLQMEADLLLRHVLELTVQVFEESGAGLFARDHRDRRFTGRATALGRMRAAGRSILAVAEEQPFQRFDERQLILSRFRDVTHLEGILIKSALELPTSTKKPTLYCSDRDSHDLSDLPVRKILQV
jgi:hypothetical protein